MVVAAVSRLWMWPCTSVDVLRAANVMVAVVVAGAVVVGVVAAMIDPVAITVVVIIAVPPGLYSPLHGTAVSDVFRKALLL